MQPGRPAPDDQPTLILRPPAEGPRHGLWRRAVLAALAGLGLLAGWWLAGGWSGEAPLASEAVIAAHTDRRTAVFRFAANPRILVIDYASLREQGLALNRIAAFVEKAGQPHDRVLDSAALGRAITQAGGTVESYYYGHDYGAPDLAQFFALADRDGIRLGDDEERLRALLHRGDGRPGAVISLTQAGPDGVEAFTRRVILRHELSHGEFFTNPAYADFVRRFWAGALSPGQRAAFRRFLGGLGYDVAIEELMLNEMQAFLMFTPDDRYFTPGWIGAGPAELAELRRRFLATMPPGWLRDTAAAPLPRRRRAMASILRRNRIYRLPTFRPTTKLTAPVMTEESTVCAQRFVSGEALLSSSPK